MILTMACHPHCDSHMQEKVNQRAVHGLWTTTRVMGSLEEAILNHPRLRHHTIGPSMGGGL